MSNKKLLVILAIVVTVCAVYLAFRYTFRESEKSVASEPSVANLASAQLLRLFEENEDSANRLYLGKVISVTGIIDSYSEDSISLSVYLKAEEEFSGVMCVFDKTMINSSSIRTGTEATIKGICSGYLFDVILNRCALID